MTEITDEQIIAYEDSLREASKVVPLLGVREYLFELLEEYKDNPGIVSKLNTLDLQKYAIRRSRGDGNCFYRAFGFGYLEFLLSCYTHPTDDDKQVLLLSALQKYKEAAALLECVGFQKLVYEDYKDAFDNVLNNLIPELASQYPHDEAAEKLRLRLEEDGLSDSLVVLLRLITSAYLRINESNYSCFLENEMTMDDFCNTHVENFGRESDHLHIVAISEALHTHITVLYMDASNNLVQDKHDRPRPTRHSFHPLCEVNNPNKCLYVSLLYRPGHYDLLYDPDIDHVDTRQ